MSHNHGSSSAGGIKIRKDPFLAEVYWMFVGGAIAIALLVNIKEKLEYSIRMRNAAKGQLDPARPKNILSGCLATITAIAREFTNYTAPLIPRPRDGEDTSWNGKLLRRFPRLSHLPPLGYMWLMACNLSILLATVFFGYDVRNGHQYESIGVRAGWMTITQLPLVFLMAGKANIIGRLTGTSYERLNWIHRSVSRCMFITAMIHMSYYLRSWARFAYIGRKLEIDIHSRRGLGAFCSFTWLVISSLAPIRGWRYEIFVIQHMISAIGFLVIVWAHVPRQAQIYVWFPVALWAFDRVVRWGYMAYHNIAVFHPKPQTDDVRPPSFFACKAVFSRLDDNTTRITIANPPMKWKPGQHAAMSCHSLALLEAHPFTISSLPSDRCIEFVVRAHAGCTKVLHDHAGLLPPQSEEPKTIFLDGPFGRMRPLEQFDSVVLLSGSTGASFTVPLLRDLIRRKTENRPLITRKIRFVWVVKSRGQVQWFSKVLGEALEALSAGDGKLEVETSIYVTCDSELTAEIERTPQLGSEAASSSMQVYEKGANIAIIDKVDTKETEEVTPGCGPNGSCCCKAVVENEDDIVDAGVQRCNCSIKPKLGPDTALSQSVTDSSSSSSVHRSLKLPESVHFVSGRPMVKNVIEKELEKARGESAVIVCGPHSLVQATRTVVVELSDERAVHKGTGAQGIYLHTEAFSW